MICHLIFEHEYTQHFNDFIDMYFDINNHVFIVYDHSSIGYKKEYNFKNSHYIKLNDNGCLAILLSASAIIVHGLFYEQIVDLLVTHKELLTKTAWMLWGGDLYSYRNSGTEMHSEEFENKRRQVISDLSWIICPVVEDFELACSVYKSRAEHLYGFYSMTIDFDYLDKIRPTIKASGPARILVGNSATLSNQHEEILHVLSRFKGEDIQTYCPLTYGDKDYANRVEQLGTKLFGNKFYPITEAMPFNQYAEFLASIDVGIMNHNRQQGLGTIAILLYLGKKVYIRTDISSYTELSRRGISLFDVEGLKTDSIHTVACYSDAVKSSNIDAIRREYSREACYKALSKVFNSIETVRYMNDERAAKNFDGSSNEKNRDVPYMLTLQSILSQSRIKLYAGDVPDQPEYSDWIGLSLTQQNDRHIIHDITTPLPFPNNSVDAFQAEDVIEHIQYHLLAPVINEIYRVLKPGALFRLSIPDYGCDVLRERSVKDVHGNIIFDPGGGGTPEDPGHVWFPRIESVYRLLEKTRFHTEGTMHFLHYWDMGRPTFVARPIDYSKGYIKRTPDHDERVKKPYRPMSIVVDLYKGD